MGIGSDPSTISHRFFLTKKAFMRILQVLQLVSFSFSKFELFSGMTDENVGDDDNGFGGSEKGSGWRDNSQ